MAKRYPFSEHGQLRILINSSKIRLLSARAESAVEDAHGDDVFEDSWVTKSFATVRHELVGSTD